MSRRGETQDTGDPTEFSPAEMMIVAAARALSGAQTVLVGVGLPNIACNLARRTGAPDLELIYESGAFGARPGRLPLSIGDPSLVSGAIMVAGMAELFLMYLQAGRIDVALLGTAQIDRFGNLNTTVIGEYAQPKVRLPGSGGACEMAIHARSTIIITRLSRRTFVQRLDFQTSPGHLTGGSARAGAGFPGWGPKAVITDLASFGFAADSGEMELRSLHPGVALEQVQAEVGWGLGVPDAPLVTEPPTAEELRIIRQELDPRARFR